MSILETFHNLRTNGTDSEKARSESDRNVRGLARMVQVSPAVTLVDLTLRGVAPGTYHATIREYGDLKDGAASTGPVWSGTATAAHKLANQSKSRPRGSLGTFEVGADGRGSVFLDQPFQIWEIIGHAMVVSPRDESDGTPLANDVNTVAGVIARSAGVWDNDKMVCSCTGKTLWEERRDGVGNGML